MLRRVAALLAAVALLGASCAKSASRDGAGSDDGPSVTLDGGGDGSSTTVPGQRTTSTAKAGTPTTAPAKRTTTTGKGQTTTTALADSGAKGGAGSYARTLLRPQPVTRIVLEVMQQSGAAPQSNTLSHARTVVAANSQKQTNIAGPVALPGGAQDFTAQQIVALADRYSASAQSSTQAVVHLLFLHGTFEGDESVLGISVRGDTAAVFIDQVKSADSPFVSESVIEDAVTEHELGHLLGLVDLVLHTGRGDPKHPGHSKNDESVMFWAVESGLVGQVLGGDPPVDFDADDRADLAAIRNGG